MKKGFDQKKMKYLGLTWQKNQLWPWLKFDILFHRISQKLLSLCLCSLHDFRVISKGTDICNFNENSSICIKRTVFCELLSKFCLLVRYVGIQSPLWLWLKVFWPIWRRLSKSPFAKSRSESAKLSKTELLLFHFTDFYRMWIELT